MKHFITTQIISISFLVSIILSWEFFNSYEMGLWVSFFVTTILTKFLAHERWIIILYTYANFVIDIIIIYIIIYITDNFGHSNSWLGLGLLLTFPILTLILLFGSLAGVAFSIKLEE